MRKGRRNGREESNREREKKKTQRKITEEGETYIYIFTVYCT